jgi:serine/threonine-protein kinase RsbW
VSSLRNADVEVYFGSDLSYLDMVQEVADKISELVSFDDDARYWIGLAVREAVTNAIQHGNEGNLERRVQLRFKMAADRLVIAVRDEGGGLDESKIPDPLDPQNLLKPGGRGIFFVRSFMDNVRISNCPEGGCELIMEKLQNQKHQGEENDD